MADSDEVDPQAPALPRGRRRGSAAANVPSLRIEPEPEAEANAPEVQPNIPVRGRGRRRVAAEPVADELEAEPPRRASRGRRPVAEAPAEVEAEPPAEEVAEPPPRRASRGRSVAEPPAEEEQEEEEEEEPPRRGLRRLRHENANRQRNENNNGNDAPIGPDEDAEGEDAEGAEEEREGEGDGEDGAGGAMGMIAQMLQGFTSFLKKDPIEESYDGAREEPPYPAVKDLYDRVKENPDDQDVIEEASTSFTELKNGFQPEGCDTDINIAMKQRCAGVKAGLYLGLYDIRKSIDESLTKMRPIQQPAVLRRIDRAARPEYEVANNDNEANVFVPADL